MSFNLLSRGNMQREKTRRAKIPLVFFFLTPQLHLTVMKFYQQETWDTISSCQTLLLLRTSATNLLNQHITVIFPLFSSVIIFTEYKVGQRKWNTFLRVLRVWPHDHPLPGHVICFFLVDVLMKRTVCSRLIFWCCSHYDPLLVFTDIFISCAQQKCT